MTAVLKAWLGFLALGAGLIHLALAIGAPPVFGMPVLLIGIAEFVWGVFALTAAALPFPRVARIASVVPLLLWSLVLILPAGNPLPGPGAVPLLVASLLDVGIALALTVLLRRSGSPVPAPLRPVRYLLAVGAGALAVAALTTLALVSTGAAWSDAGFDLPGAHLTH